MITKIKKVYYCEFCKKHSLRPLVKHEKSCTLNPNRICGVCSGGDIENLIKKYSNRYKIVDLRQVILEDMETMSEEIEWINGEVKLVDILNDTEGCPACTLAVLRLCKLNTFPIQLNFDYKKTHKEWWDEEKQCDVRNAH